MIERLCVRRLPEHWGGSNRQALAVYLRLLSQAICSKHVRRVQANVSDIPILAINPATEVGNYRDDLDIPDGGRWGCRSQKDEVCLTMAPALAVIDVRVRRITNVGVLDDHVHMVAGSSPQIVVAGRYDQHQA